MEPNYFALNLDQPKVAVEHAYGPVTSEEVSHRVDYTYGIDVGSVPTTVSVYPADQMTDDGYHVQYFSSSNLQSWVPGRPFPIEYHRCLFFH